MDLPKKDSTSYFEGSRFVEELSPEDFDPVSPWKSKGNKCAIVLYYKPGCPHCKAVKDTWSKLGETAAFFDVYALNAEKHKAHVAKIREDMPNLITSYPTIIIYKDGSPQEHYQGERSVGKLTGACMRVCIKKYGFS
uniref:Thioredoxin n=1 Tax=Marseillevirus LCMAC101 TaxID=2506602 RepID=A0A481YR80_9VIRU|nr:MAG: thioredoxin [Marseillevirus LCMAC101]